MWRVFYSFVFAKALGRASLRTFDVKARHSFSAPGGRGLWMNEARKKEEIKWLYLLLYGCSCSRS